MSQSESFANPEICGGEERSPDAFGVGWYPFSSEYCSTLIQKPGVSAGVPVPVLDTVVEAVGITVAVGVDVALDSVGVGVAVGVE